MLKVVAAADIYELSNTRWRFCEEIVRDCSNEEHLELYLQNEEALLGLLAAVREYTGRSESDFDSYR